MTHISFSKQVVRMKSRTHLKQCRVLTKYLHYTSLLLSKGGALKLLLVAAVHMHVQSFNETSRLTKVLN